MKLHATERMRIAIDDAMDIHGGKAVIDGPQNYLGRSLSLGAGRHHRRRRQHPDPQSDRVWAGRDPRAIPICSTR
jgi:alkylation response protein AidB-like acyl-CoA dehydrogenase